MLTEQEARDAIIVALDCDRETALQLADKLEGKTIVKEIYVPGRIVNIVVK